MPSGKQAHSHRVIEWVAPGYEGSYTQYTVTTDGWVYVVQIATRANMARKMQTVEPVVVNCRTVENAERYVDGLIVNRIEGPDPIARELSPVGVPL